MARVITLSRTFLQGHPRAGMPTFFISSVWDSLYYDEIPGDFGGPYPSAVDWVKWLDGECEHKKHHTIRFGRRWKTGDMASLRVWSGKPYRSPQCRIAPDVQLRVVDIVVDYDKRCIFVDDDGQSVVFVELSMYDPRLQTLSANDGLSPQDFLDWFGVGKKTGVHEAQILIWGNVNEY